MVNDFSLSVMTVTADNYVRLPARTREMLRVYATRSWGTDRALSFEVASYRVDEIMKSCEEVMA